MQVDLTNLDLDLTLLNEIADGSDEFIVESIGMFLDQAPDTLQGIANGLENSDWPAAGGAAHKLKATLGFFGMLNSQALLAQIESSCKTGSPDVEELTAKLEQANTLITASSAALSKIKEEAAANL